MRNQHTHSKDTLWPSRHCVLWLILCINVVFFSCTGDNLDSTAQSSIHSGFQKIETSQSNISFTNNLIEDENLNYFTYPYLYMGGGVAIGDINNDGLDDVLFSGNMVSNRLYLNKGNFVFEDISESAGLLGEDKWYAGITMVDINEDGFLDIYCSVSGKDKSTSNELYINNQDLTFTESASKYGLDDTGKSVQSTFFDFDKDGDLDCYVANYPITPFSTSNQEYRKRMDNVSLENSDHFYQNNGDGTFKNITQEAGLLSFGLSLSATVGDLNGDGWEDIYISNDFSTPDYLYVNNQDGTFTESLKKSTKQTAFYGMGADIADYNNDGLLDIMQVDMAAEDNRRAKANMASMNPGLFWSTVDFGMHYQYMYNALQLNRGTKDGTPIMSNVAWAAGVSTTDWSWGPLFADFDNDGWKDLFISNGTRRDINNRDFFLSLKKDLEKIEKEDLPLEVKKIPSEPIGNYIFKNNKDLTYSKANKLWNLDMVGFSNGVAYADLDNDGFLDLVVNNIDEPAYVYKNNLASVSENTQYISIKLSQDEGNRFALGSKIKLVAGSKQQWQHLTLTRGFQSSVSPTLHFGLGKKEKIDSLIVTWPDNSQTIMTDVSPNQTLTIKKDKQNKSAELAIKSNQTAAKYFTDVSTKSPLPVHIENEFDDYRFQILLPHKMSQWGPALATGDINGDGLEDFYLGGASRSAGQIFLQKGDQQFEHYLTFEGDEIYEDMDAQFIDIDLDGDLDLIVISGGYELPYNKKFYADRLYLNDGGQFTKSENFPNILSSGGCVRPFDFDHDGDLDLFVGGRMRPAQYPASGTSYFLRNDLQDGVLSFTDVTNTLVPDIEDIGMVTDAIWTDYNGDKKTDLVLVGEWMPITVFLSDGNTFSNQTSSLDLEDTRAWWFTIEQGDLNGDKRPDYVLGNLGKNYKYKASEEEPFSLYIKDFDQNASNDIVLSYYNNGKQYPLRGRQCSSDQIPGIKTKFKDYESFANATLTEVYGKSQIASAENYAVRNFESIVMLSQADGSYISKSLPISAQMSAITDISITDINADGHLDLISAGNLYVSEVETPRNDSGIGCTLIGNGKGDFKNISYLESGLLLDNDIRKLAILKSQKNKVLLSASNDGPMAAFLINKN